ncbi:MAG: MarR family transcriptional regulator [Thermodesulfobacteriota bacterium]
MPQHVLLDKTVRLRIIRHQATSGDVGPVFYLRDLPDDKTLHEFAERYQGMDPSAVKACIVLARTASDLLTAFETMLSKHGLSQGRFLTLIVMNRRPDESITPSELAEKVGVTRATMTGLLDGLHGDVLIERELDHRDRRRVRVRLTRRGREALERVLPDYYRRTSQLMARLEEGERRQLLGLLAKVNQGLPRFVDPE